MAHGGSRDRAPDRARGRRRLLDVLLAARARGAGRRAQRRSAALEAAAATSGRSVLISGLTVMVGDGRHVPDRRLDVRVVRRRDDRRRRDRGARLADRPARAALEARRPGRPGARPVPRPARRQRRRGPDLGRDHRPRPPAAGRCRRSSPAGCWSRSPLPALQLRMVTPGAGHVPAVAPGREDLRPHAAGVPRHGAAGHRRREGSERERTRGARGDRPARAARRSRAAGCTSRSRSTSTGDATVANITDPDRRHGNRPRVDRGDLARSASEVVPETVGRLAEHRGRRDRARGPVEGHRPTS